MYTIGTLLLTRVTGLRPSLLVVNFLVRTQVSLPSPRVFLRVIGKLIRWLTNSIDAVLPSLLVSVRIGLMALRIRLIVRGTLLRLCRTECILLLNTPLCIRVRQRLMRKVVMTRARNVPAEVIVTLGFVQAHRIVLDLCGTAEFMAP